MRKCRGPERVIFDTQKNEQAILPLGSIIEMLHRHSQMTCKQCMGAYCVTLDDTHVCKEDDNFRVQLYTAHRTSMVYCPCMAKRRISRCQKSSKCIAKRQCTYCFSDILTFIIALSSSKYTLEVFYNKVVSENVKKQ